MSSMYWRCERNRPELVRCTCIPRK
uniref:Uncharacterized protein n=1 Tax=Arundo donax TaxID=35708 RepID=A0A0A9APH7_ARUDO